MLELRNIHKDYYVDKTPYPALKDVSLVFEDRGFVAILGPSGCGKTTLLNIIGGLDHATKGTLLIDGKTTEQYTDSDWDAYRNERVGFVFQSYNLIPHMNVLSNVETSLLLNGASKSEREEKALAALESVGLKDVAKKRPNQLSGGQMQRVALARAIVNNPKIVLADEPTGALDSVTSIQVMDILKGISKDRLVIMVTHNRELAVRYSDRIIEFKDGEVVSDSAPAVPSKDDGEAFPTKLKTKKTSMSFWTALRNSLNNIRTKKARTILTAVASSIGIFGVALVLAVSNGFQIYVDNVEGSMASSVPITISKVSYSVKTETTPLPEQYPDDNVVNVYDSSTSTYVVHTNYYDYEYIENVINPLVDDGYARSVLVNHDGLDFNVLKKVTSKTTGDEKVIKIDQTKSAGGISSAVSSVTSLPTTIFHELFGEEEGVLSMYDCIYGKYPTNSNELVLIVDRYNRVNLSTLVALGLISEDDEETTQTISFDEIMQNGTYKAYLNSKFYYQTEDVDTKYFPGYTSITPHLQNGKITLEGDADASDSSYRKKVGRVIYSNDYGSVYENDEKYAPKELKIVGVLRPSRDSYLQLMPNSIGYLSSLTDEFVKDTEENCGVIHGLNENAWYVPTGWNGGTYTKSDDGVIKLQTALNSLLEGMTSEAGLSSDLITNIASAIRYTYWSVTEKGVSSMYNIGLSTYLKEARRAGCDFRVDLVGKLIDALNYGEGSEKTAAITSFIERLLESSFYSNSHESAAYDIDSETLNMDFNIVDLVAYFQSYSLISSILIFPASLTTKDTIKARLDAYNSGLIESKQIVYSDIMSTFTESLSIMIQVLSTVLIVFASISLVVSSIMTSIITYVSVVERTKEIGILRACGARKKDVRRVFEAECAIVGLVAGAIGVLVGYVCTPIINVIVSSMYPGNNLEHIAQLSVVHAIALIAISIALALISGLIPSHIGAKKDPVICLRTE